MEADVDRIIISRDRIHERIHEMADEIVAAYPDGEATELTLVTILSGSIIFLADLVRHLPLRMKIGLITVSSYPGAATESQGAKILSGLNTDITGRHVVVVDDILDTGGTLRLVGRELAEHKPKSIRTCVLLRKPTKAPEDVPADFVGFDIADDFVVGYGLDYNDHYRNLPDIGVLRPDLVES